MPKLFIKLEGNNSTISSFFNPPIQKENVPSHPYLKIIRDIERQINHNESPSV